MKYIVDFGIYESLCEEIEAQDENEARKIADSLVDDLLSKVRRPSPRVEVSPNNFLLQKGGVYLIRYYKRYLPAVCTYSDALHWGANRDYLHEFRYLSKDKYIVLHGEYPERLGRMLCTNAKDIDKPECEDCVARFYCFTNKGVL